MVQAQDLYWQNWVWSRDQLEGKADLPGVEERSLVQGNPERSHDDQLKEEPQQQRNQASQHHSHNQGLQELLRGTGGHTEMVVYCCGATSLGATRAAAVPSASTRGL